MVFLYSLTIFVGAALLFAVQPLFTKLLLPLLGGSPNVWSTAVAFFQAALLAGYLYAHFATKALGVRRQAAAHVAVLLAPLAVLPLGLAAGAAPPPDGSPAGWLLRTMLVTVGPPFFALAATGPLLQRWFAATGHERAKDPYFLYAAGNLGSMLALIAYPTAIEPWLRLRAQTAAWAWLYGALVIAMIGCALFVWRAPPAADPEVVSPEAALPEEALPEAALPEAATPPKPGGEARLATPTLARRARWVVLAFVPSSLMMSVTTYLTSDVASVPLLWVIPLALYLATFILAFLPRPLVAHASMVQTGPRLIVAAAVLASVSIELPLWLPTALALATFFVIAMVCHGELAKDRPDARRSTEFYLWISAGGALGGAFAGLLAPVVFSTIAEYRITLAAAALLLPATRLTLEAEGERHERLLDYGVPALVAVASFLAMILERRGILGFVPALLLAAVVPASICLAMTHRTLRYGLSVVALLAAGWFRELTAPGIVLHHRNFFGAIRVAELAPNPPVPREGSIGAKRALFHGITLHGVQAIAEPDSGRPLAYYAPEGPIGQVFRRVVQPRARVGAVGLGIGALAAYATPEQAWTFFEIDPRIAKIASDPRYFTQLRDARAPYRLVLGDARLSLARAPAEERYDLLVLDAYSSDSVPIHLLTLEAMRLYLERLAEGGVMAFHVSSRYFDLPPVIAALAGALDLRCFEQQWSPTFEEALSGGSSSRWVLVARRAEDLGPLAQDRRWHPIEAAKGAPVWTDDYSSVARALLSPR